MTDFGTPEERSAALRACEACKELNAALASAAGIGVNIKIRDIHDDWDDRSEMTIARMERRTRIVPTLRDDADVA